MEGGKGNRGERMQSVFLIAKHVRKEKKGYLCRYSVVYQSTSANLGAFLGISELAFVSVLEAFYLCVRLSVADHEEDGRDVDAHRVDTSTARAVAVYGQVCVADVLTSLFDLLQVDFASRARKGLLRLCYTQFVTGCADKSEVHNETCSGQCYLKK